MSDVAGKAEALGLKIKEREGSETIHTASVGIIGEDSLRCTGLQRDGK